VRLQPTTRSEPSGKDRREARLDPIINSITRGFSAIKEPNVAVCLLPGTELVFDREVQCDSPLLSFPKRKLREKGGALQANQPGQYL
jgi:hypothetical protein